MSSDDIRNTPLPNSRPQGAEEHTESVRARADEQTLAAYDKEALVFAEDWHKQPPPSDLHEIIKRFFNPGLTADVGCGSGRYVAWLTANGFPPSATTLARAPRK
jgi:hypothetical protein